MAVPKIANLASGSHAFEHGGANWTPLACTEHAERGYVESCGSCVETARGTIAHALAVEAEQERVG